MLFNISTAYMQVFLSAEKYVNCIMQARFLLLFCMLISNILFAQVRELGIKTGISNSLIEITEKGKKYNTSEGQSFYTQVFAQVYHFNNFSVQAGFGLIEKNSKYLYKTKITGMIDSVTVSTQLETRSFFTEIDAKFKILIPEMPKVIPYILIGGQYLILNKQTYSINFGLQKQQFQGVLGLGADVDFRKLHLFLEYNRFLTMNTNYSKNSDFQYFEQSGVYLLGLKFILPPKKSK
jgi:hypothetical protein